GQLGLGMQSSEHDPLADSEYRREFQSCCSACPNRVSDEAYFTQEVTRPQRIQYHSLALSRDDSDLHLSSLNKIDSVRLFSLRKEFCVPTKSYKILTHDNVFEHALDGGIDLRGFQPSNLPCPFHTKNSSCRLL